MTENQNTSRRWLYLWPAILLLAGLVVYANSFDGIFLFDDEPHILRNEKIRHLLPPWDLLTARRPVLTITLAINYAVSEMDPWSYHALNLTVHILASLTLFGVVRRTLCLESLGHRFGQASHHIAGAVALIWLVHPLQTQSVTYVIQRGEALMGLFYLLTLYGLVRSTQSRQPLGWLWVSIVSCALGMGSKAVMVTAPVMLLLYDRTFISRSFRETIRRRWVFYIGLTLTWSVLWMCGIVQGVFKTTPTDSHVGFSYMGITPLEYAVTQPGVLLHYLKLSIWPRSLCLDYNWPVAKSFGDILFPSIVIASLVILTVWACIYRPKAGFLGAWFFVILSPTSSFIPIKDLAFEHRMYLSLVAVIITAVLIVRNLLDRRLPVTGDRSRWRRYISTSLLAGVVILLGMGTMQRNKVYYSTGAMWQDVLTKQTDNYRAHLGIGIQYFYDGKLDQAVNAYQNALHIKPAYADGHYNLGVALAEQGKIEPAIRAYRRAIQLNPKHQQAYFALGWLFMQQNQSNEGLRVFQRAVEVTPENSKAHLNLANVLGQLDRLEEAILEFQRAIELQQDLSDGYYGLGMAYMFLHRREDAVQALNTAIRWQPDHKRARQALEQIRTSQKP